MRWLPEILLGSIIITTLYLTTRYGISGQNTKLSHVSSANNSALRYIPSKSGLEFVRIHFADNTTEDIPPFAFQELFSLPPNYLCSSIKVTYATNRSARMKTFFIECHYVHFCTFLLILHSFVTEFIKVTEFSKDILKDLNEQQKYDYVNNLIFSTQRLQDDIEIASPILRKFVKSDELMNWLTEFLKGKGSNYLYAIDILQEWDSEYRFAYPVVFLQDLSYESNGEHNSLTLRTLKSANHPSKIGSGGFSTCFRVNFKCSCDGVSNYCPLVFKRLKKKYKSNGTIRLSLREFSIFQRGGVTSLEKYSVPYAVVMKSSKKCIPIGYLMKMAEHGDLIQFLKNRPNAILTKYFIGQLLELAKAINNLHKRNIFHLNIDESNIFVRKITPKDTNDENDENDYEFIVGDFGSSGMKEWNLKCEGNFKETMKWYPPEYFSTFSGKIQCDSYSDFYMFGMMLNSLTTIFNDPAVTTKIGYFFSYIINGTFTFHPEQRWDFAEVEKYFNYILENHDPNLCIMRYPHDKDGKVPTWFYKPTKLDPNLDYKRYAEEYKTCNFEYVHFIIDPKNPNQTLSKHLHENPVQMKRPILYEFHRGFPYAISLPQTNHQKKFFFKGSLLLFEQDVFCYAEFYDCDGNNIESTIATYDYLEIIEKINSAGEYIRIVEQ